MITFVQIWHILIIAFTGYIVGVLWYSPVLFLKPWMRGVGKTNEDLDAHKKEMPRIMAYSFLVSLATATGLFVFLEVLGADTILFALQIALLIAFAFVVTAKLADMLYASREPHWSQNPQQLFFTEAGYAVASFSAMAVTFVFLN